MSDHSKEGAHHSPDSTTYNTPADSDESDTPRPVTTVSLPAVHVTTATPRSSEVAAGARPIPDSQSLPAANTTPTGYASPRSPGFASVAGPSSASYFHQQQPTPSSTSFDSSSRFKRHSLVPSMGTGGTIQESPIEEELDDSRSKLVPDQPLSQSPSQVSVPVPPPKPPSRNPSLIREPRSTYPNPTRRVSLPEPDLTYSPHGRRQRSYDITYDRPRSANGRRSEPALSPRPSWHVDRRFSDHEPAYYERDNGHRSASRNGNGRDSGYGERPYRDERPYPEVMAEEGRISRRSILEQNSIPTQNELQLLKELSLKEERDEFRYPLGSVGSRLSPTLKHAKAALLEAQKTSKATGWALNVAIGAQVILGALTTGVAAATTGRQTSIATSILGGLSTLAASYLAKSRGSGEPETSITKCNSLEQFVRDCEAFLLDYGYHDGRTMELHIGRYRKRFEEIQGNDSTGVAEGVVEKTLDQQQQQHQHQQQIQGQTQARDFQGQQPQAQMTQVGQQSGVTANLPGQGQGQGMPVPATQSMPPMPPLPMPGGFR